MKLPISAMVVGFNEAHYLKTCLESIDFCDEIFYTDLGSTDDSVNIAKRFTNEIYYRDRACIPSCEMVQAELVHQLKNDWIIFLDPDERLDQSLGEMIRKEFTKIVTSEKLGAVMVPWQFYFKKSKLKGTVWGGVNKKYVLVNRHRFQFMPIVHYGRKLLPEFEVLEVPYDGKSNVLHHYWMDSLSVFIRKHRRYLKNEGHDQYIAGTRIGKKEALLRPLTAFNQSYFIYKGYKDGAIGFLLSLFWTCYQSYIAFDLLLIQRRYRKGQQKTSGINHF
jgi:glycosyltransferase involved in cell wall biosynthesis